MNKVNIVACCDKCGNFEVVRARGKRLATSGETYDLPRNVVCPKCRMWATIIRIEQPKGKK